MENVFSEKAKVTKIEKISQFRQTGEKVPTLAPTEKTREQVAKTANVSHDTIAKAKANQKLSEGKGIQKSEDLKKTEVVAIKEVAKTANVSHDTIAKVKVIQAKATEEVKEKLSSGNLSINEANM